MCILFTYKIIIAQLSCSQRIIVLNFQIFFNYTPAYGHRAIIRKIENFVQSFTKSTLTVLKYIISSLAAASEAKYQRSKIT